MQYLPVVRVTRKYVCPVSACAVRSLTTCKQWDCFRTFNFTVIQLGNILLQLMSVLYIQIPVRTPSIICDMCVCAWLHSQSFCMAVMTNLPVYIIRKTHKIRDTYTCLIWTKHNFYHSATDAICKQTPVWDHPADRDRDLPISKSGVPGGFS